MRIGEMETLRFLVRYLDTNRVLGRVVILVVGTLLLITAVPALAAEGDKAINWWNMAMLLFGGLAIFLFGMDQMGGALKDVAGDRLVITVLDEVLVATAVLLLADLPGQGLWKAAPFHIRLPGQNKDLDRSLGIRRVRRAQPQQDCHTCATASPTPPANP